MPTRIVCDSIADLPIELAQAFDITIIPQLVIFGDHSQRDRVDIFPTEFYQRLVSSPTLPTTAAAGPGEFASEYSRLVNQGCDVVSIHVAAQLSGIYNSARLAASEFAGRVLTVDSTNVTMAQGWLAVEAAALARQGASAPEVAAACERLAPRLRVWAMLDTLEFLRKGGRISVVQALFGSLLHVKPMIMVRDSTVSLTENVRTLRKAVDRLAQQVVEAGPAARLAVLHAAAPHLADEVRRRLADHHPADQIVITEAGPVLGVHIGPGAVGVAALLA